MARRNELERLDAALLALRRFVAAPGAARSNVTLRHGRDRVEISTVLVVDAVARFKPVGDCSIGEVAGALQVAHSTSSRLVERAVRAGMVHRGRSGTDPRRTVLTLTAAGRRLHRDAVGFRTGRLDALLSDWSAADVTTFANLLERFARCVHPLTQESP